MTNYNLEITKAFIDFAKACVEFDKRPKNEKMYFTTNYGHFDEDGGKWFINKTIAKNSFYESDLLALYCMGADTNNQERIRNMLKLPTNAFAIDDNLAKVKGQFMNNTNILDTWFGHKNTWFFKKYKIKTFGSPHNWAVFCIKLAEINGGLESISSLLSFYDFKNLEESEVANEN